MHWGIIRWLDRLRHSSANVALMVAIMGCMPAWAAGAQPVPASTARVEFNIPAGDLAVALDRLSTQAGIQFMYQPELVAGKQVKALSGQLAWQEALDRLLQGSGLEYQQINPTTIVIRKAAGGAKPGSSAAPASRSKRVAEKAAEPTTLQTVAVTGTRIRGGVTASPTITIGAQQIQDEGFSDLGEVIRSVPQNFSGGQNPGVTLSPGGSDSNQNLTGGSGMNLRGLGPDATLTLLNGHRMAYGGFSQSVDISAIPIEAVQRIEIVPDGASAIYGSDAVGGVANVILKRDFNGVTLSALYGSATGGGLTTHEYTATAGTTWATGGLIAAGEKTFNDPIYSSQRDYTQSMYQPSTLWQGSNLRSGLFSLHQAFGNAVELHLDALGSERGVDQVLAYASVYDPYNVKTKNTMLAPSLDIWLPGDWTLTLSGAVGKEQNSMAQPSVNRADGVVTANSLNVYRNKSLTYEIGAEGPLFTLPAGEAKLATGVGYRYDDYLELVGSTIDANGGESGHFAYAELNLPLVEPKQGIGGIERLELTGALRTENGDYGRVTTPKLGVIYSPNADFSLKASWGKSFKAPTLNQRYTAGYAFYYPAATWGGGGYPKDAAVLVLSGGQPDLHP